MHTHLIEACKRLQEYQREVDDVKRALAVGSSVFNPSEDDSANWSLLLECSTLEEWQGLRRLALKWQFAAMSEEDQSLLRKAIEDRDLDVAVASLNDGEFNNLSEEQQTDLIKNSLTTALVE